MAVPPRMAAPEDMKDAEMDGCDTTPCDGSEIGSSSAAFRMSSGRL